MQKDKKKIHNKIVRRMRTTNKQLASDKYLGLNRFRIDLFSEKWHKYSDGSGHYVRLIFKLSDKITGNSAYFISSNYSYNHELFIYANDFLIRCSSGTRGHTPSLSYIAYDVHEIVPYSGRNNTIPEPKENIIDTYDRTSYGFYKEK